MTIEYCDSLHSLSMPQLSQIGGDMRIYQNVSYRFTDITLPSLTTIGGDLYIYNNTALTSLSLDDLTTIVGYLYIGNSPALTSFSLHSLTTIGEHLYLSFNSALTSFSLDALTTIGDYLYMYGNSALTQVNMPSLSEITGYRRINLNGNTGTSGSYPYSIYFRTNANLPSCQYTYYKDNVTRTQGSAYSTGLGRSDCTCEMVDGELISTCP